MAIPTDPSELAEAAKCYCFSKPTARAVKLYLLAVAAGLGDSTPADIAEAAKCFCLDLRSYFDTEIYLWILAATAAGADVPTDPSELAAESRCFCFEQPLADEVMIYALANLAGLESSTPSELAALAVCWCADAAEYRKMEIYLLLQLAVSLGYAGSTDPQDLVDAARCYKFPRTILKKSSIYTATEIYLEIATENGEPPPSETGFLLRDTGDFILLNDGSKIIIHV